MRAGILWKEAASTCYVFVPGGDITQRPWPNTFSSSCRPLLGEDRHHVSPDLDHQHLRSQRFITSNITITALAVASIEPHQRRSVGAVPVRTELRLDSYRR